MTNDGINSLIYDGENHVVTAAGWAYVYDGNGLRVRSALRIAPAPRLRLFTFFPEAKSSPSTMIAQLLAVLSESTSIPKTDIGLLGDLRTELSFPQPPHGIITLFSIDYVLHFAFPLETCLKNRFCQTTGRGPVNQEFARGTIR